MSYYEQTQEYTTVEAAPGWVRRLRSYTLPDDDDIEDIINVVKTHSRCRVTVETWERR